MTEIQTDPAPSAPSPSTPSPRGLYQRWQAILSVDGPKRIRAAADALGVSEFELRVSAIGEAEDDARVTRLQGPWRELIARLPELGEVMALTRNPSAVHEKIGRYADIRFHGDIGLVLNHDIDLRLFMSSWSHAVAVFEPSRAGGFHRSLQFFDAAGTAVHKIYLREDSDRPAYDALVADYRAPEEAQISRADLEPRPDPVVETPDDQIDATGFQDGWRGLNDTHDFFPMLRRFGVTRIQALRLAPEGFARRVGLNSIVELLERASATHSPIMVFVGNRGCIQIHSGPVERVVPTGPWINVLDPGFNLHLRVDEVAAAWVVRKPTEDGIVSSLELFDAGGETIAMLFGERKPGQAEREDWRDRLGELADLET